jgi:FAD/FMN-containing dehydrogenase
LEKVSGAGRAPFLAALKVSGEENEAALGFPLRGFNLALDLPATEGVVEFARELDAITLEYGGRVYLAKDSTTTPETVRAMYPRLSEWEAVRNQLDPEGRFQSSLSKRLKIGANAGGAA